MKFLNHSQNILITFLIIFHLIPICPLSTFGDVIEPSHACCSFTPADYPISNIGGYSTLYTNPLTQSEEIGLDNIDSIALYNIFNNINIDVSSTSHSFKPNFWVQADTASQIKILSSTLSVVPFWDSKGLYLIFKISNNAIFHSNTDSLDLTKNCLSFSISPYQSDWISFKQLLCNPDSNYLFKDMITISSNFDTFSRINVIKIEDGLSNILSTLDSNSISRSLFIQRNFSFSVWRICWELLKINVSLPCPGPKKFSFSFGYTSINSDSIVALRWLNQRDPYSSIEHCDDSLDIITCSPWGDLSLFNNGGCLPAKQFSTSKRTVPAKKEIEYFVNPLGRIQKKSNISPFIGSIRVSQRYKWMK